MMLAQAMGYNSEDEVIQNLKDAGCGQEIIACFMKCMARNDLSGQLGLMKEHRQFLLDKVHEEEKRIDCLDYLVYRIDHSRTGN